MQIALDTWLICFQQTKEGVLPDWRAGKAAMLAQLSDLSIMETFASSFLVDRRLELDSGIYSLAGLAELRLY